ncbi:MAG: TRAP transporter small permease [Deltaproteobacteria bacterium]|nr:TRAP transporter small permease [Deltaproteobacteria bacterium]
MGLKLVGPASGISRVLKGAAGYRESAADDAPDEESLAQAQLRRWLKREVPRAEAAKQAVGMFVPAAIALGFATEWAMRAVQPVATEVLMHGTIWAAFLGASYATRGRKHLAIDALSRMLPDRGRRFLVGVSATLGAFVAMALGTGVYRTLMESVHTANNQVQEMVRNGVTAAVDRQFEFQFIIPAGFGLIGLRLLLHAFHEFVAALAGGRAPAAPPHQTLRRSAPPRTRARGGAAGAPAIERADAPRWWCRALRSRAREVTAGSTVFKPALAMALLAALVVVAPFMARKGQGPAEHGAPLFRGTAAHIAMAAVLVVAILAVMRYGLVPNIRGDPRWGWAWRSSP